MPFKTFSEFVSKIDPILLEGFTATREAPVAAEKLDAARKMFDEAEQLFPEERQTLLLFRIALAAVCRDVEAAAGTLEMALNQGFCYPTRKFNFALTPIRDSPAIQQLMKRNDAQFRDFIHNTPCDFLVIEPQHTTVRPPLLIALHGNRGKIANLAEQYRFAAAKGWLVALPESVVKIQEGYAMWTDDEMDAEQVQPFYAELKRKYAFDETCVVLTGLSAGGWVAVDLSLKGTVPSRGFIAQATSNAPENREQLIPLIDASRERGVRAYVSVGDQDTNCYKETINLANLLKERNLPCEVEIYPGVGHEFPPNFEESLERGLRFILQSA